MRPHREVTFDGSALALLVLVPGDQGSLLRREELCYLYLFVLHDYQLARVVYLLAMILNPKLHVIDTAYR